MTAGALTRPRDLFPSSGARRAGELGATASALLVLFGLLLPIMRYLAVAGERANLCAADAVLLPLALALRKRWLRSGALGRWLFALWVVNLISWSLSLSMLAPQAFLREALKVITCLLYALVGYGLGSSVRSERVFLRSLTASSVIISLGAVCAYVARQPAFLITDSRVVGTFTDPNAFGVFLAMQIALAGSVRAAWLIIPIFLAGGAVTLSRTGLLSMIASLTLSALHIGWRRFLVIMAICLLVVAGAWRTFTANSLSRRIARYETTLGNRQELWSRALRAAAERPLFGIGRGNWEVVTRRRDVAHNTFLQVIADVGFVGFLVFVAPLAFWLGAGVKRRATRPWAIALCIGLVGGLAISLDNFRLFWLAVGVLVAKLATETRAERVRAQRSLPSIPVARHSAEAVVREQEWR